ncbi:septum formation initiator family protein [Clostridium sp. KNHs214]|uniref:FtsB family cell division protein n=1 Tax=Clostridium sp. KNHs214 TaxID=1540257 RepID=UPI000557D93C|nr:septum formation initiator family protein [Clostridium sp. KNHs214]
MKKKINFKKIIMAILVVYIIGIFVNQQVTIGKVKEEKNQKKQELSTVKEKNNELQDQVQMSKSDSYIEKIAREKLNFIKKGETPVINNSSKESSK